MAVSLHGNNGLITTNGTAAAPSLAAPDNDTGLYFGTNLIHATTGGSERLRIDNDNVNIINSDLRFHGNNHKISTGSSSHLLSIQGGPTNMGGLIELRGGSSDGDIRFFAQGATTTKEERLRITSAGLISIGDNTNLDSQLTVTQAQGDCIRLRSVVTNNAFKYGIIKQEPYNNNALGVQIIGGKSDSGYSEVAIGGGIDGGYAATHIDFYTGATTTTTTGTRQLRITSGGSVLLGGATSASNGENFRIHTASSNKAIMKFTNNDTGSGSGDGLEFGLNSSEHAELVLKEDKDIIFYSGATTTEKLRITSDGWIKYIGTRTGDETNKLGRFLMPSHDTNEEDVMYFQMQQEGTFNQLEIGGGSGSYNAATKIIMRTAAVDTVTGQERFTIQSDGKKILQNGNLNISSTYIDFSGSISAPSTAAALFRPADNTLAISTANEERFRVDSTGNIHLRSEQTNRIVLGNAGGSNGTLSNNENWIRGSGTMLQLNTAGGDYGFEVSGNQKMKLDSSGNLELRSAVQNRITFGSAGSSGNDTNWIRGDGDNLMYNCRTNGAFKWEINGTQRFKVSKHGQLLQGTDSEDQGWVSLIRAGSSGSDAGTAGQDGAGDKGLNVRADMGPTHTDLTGVDNYTLKLHNVGYAGSGIGNPYGTIAKILFNSVTYNGWNSYGGIALQSVGQGGARGQLVFMLNNGTSSMNEKLRIMNTEIDTANDVGLNVKGGNIHHSNDAVIYAEKSGDSDWAIVANAQTNDYGLYVRCGNGASYGLSVYDHSNSAYRVRISGAGAIFATNTTVQSISDQRLKENIVDANSQWNDIKALKFRNFKWKADSGYGDGKTYLGLIAQEVEPISPNLIEIDAQSKEDIENGVPDPEYKTVKYSIVWMKAVKALQEAQARIETLEAKVAALEGS